MGQVPLEEALALWEPVAIAHKRLPGAALSQALGGKDVPESKALQALKERLDGIDDKKLGEERAQAKQEARREVAAKERAAQVAAHICRPCEGSGIDFRLVKTSHEYGSLAKKDWVETNRRYVVWGTAKERDRGASGWQVMSCAVGTPLPRLTKDFAIDAEDLRFTPEVMSGEFSLLYRSYLHPALCKHCRGSGDPLEKGPKRR